MPPLLIMKTPYSLMPPPPEPAPTPAPEPAPVQEAAEEEAAVVSDPHIDEGEAGDFDAPHEEEEPVQTPAVAAAAPAQPAGSTLKAFLITSATIVAAVLLLILVMIFALRAS